ncbi:MAG: prolyl oligopeptidase family serine peptidase [Burkholderiales bacterium]|nr:prolyl oligopeptidase family serine peptidase [Burkholderiales bacterium]
MPNPLRPALVAGVVLLASCATPTPTPQPRTIAGVTVAPPPAAQPQEDSFYGTRVADPYRFLENVKDPQVAGWMKGQADATTAILQTIPGRAPLLARLTEIDAAAAGAISSLRRTEGGRLFFARREPGENQFKLLLREAGGAERVLVDAEARGKAAGKVLALLDWAPAHDGRHVAYVLQVGGSEIGELHVMDVATGQDIVAPIDRIRFGSVSWLRDGSGFFFARLREGYEKLPETERFGDRTTHFFTMATRQSVAVFSPLRNAELKLPIFASGFVAEVPGTSLALLGVGLGVDRNRVAFIGDLRAATAGRAQWRRVVDASDEVRTVTAGGGFLYALSAKGAPRHRVLRMPLAAPDLARAEVVVEASDEVIVDIAAARDALYVIKRRGAAMQLVRLPHEAPRNAQTVALPIEGTVSVLDSDSQRDGLALAVVGWTRATQRFELRPAAAAGQAPTLVPLTIARTGSFDAPAQMVAREVMVPSHDGTLVPASIIHHRDLKLDGNSPTILYGYGAYGITEDPLFNPRLLAWIERGGVYVVAHVRGSGMLGTEWHRAGQKATKPNTWRDGIAVAQWLVKSGYARPQRLAIFGGSAGGIFVGRAITERPDLFAAAVPAVGVMDMVRAELDPNGPANIPEFGTVKDEAGFRALRAMSSYHHVKDGVRYPGTLLVHGVNDIRVSVWQSSKFAARLAQASTGGAVLMRLDYQLGHGGGATRAQALAQTADIWSFMLWQMGLPEFQPRP